MLRVVDEVPHVIEEPLGADGNFLAFRRQLDAVACAFDERDSERCFEVLDLHRQCRLGNRARVRCPAEVLLARERIKVTQLLERNVSHQKD